ncbi:MAG: HipA domain-containing protein [Verrucomicrobia bacterium]|nr:HipA domain-containing protein [Verrucomicrobiota bacterium]
MNTCCKCAELLENESWYGLHKPCFMDWFELSELNNFSDIIPRSQSLAPLDPYENNISFFHGAFRKYSSILGEDSYILKVVQEGHPELPATEFLCNQIYENLGIDIPKYYLVRFPENQFCFVTRNFMTKAPNSSLVHIYHYLKSGEEYNCERLVTVIGEQTKRRTEQEKFVYLTLADSLVGNHDRHGRNIGFIQSPRGMVLAPFYDNPSFIGLDDDWMLGADLQPRGAIFTKATDEPRMGDYVTEWYRLGYEAVVDRFRKSFSLEKIEQIIKVSFLSEKRKKALFRLICKRGAEL